MEHVLSGTLTRPAHAQGPVPAVVLISGSGPHERDMASSHLPGYRPFLQIAETLTRRGIAVLRVDDRGVGSSTGNFDKATPRDFARDVEAALDYLRVRKDIDPKRLGIVGHSEGGLVALMVAASDRSLRGVALLASPARNLRSIVAYQASYRIDHNLSIPLIDRDETLERTMSEWDVYAAEHPRLRFSRSYDPLPTAKKVRSPVLILHGETDRQVPPDDAEKLAGALRESGNSDVTVRLFPGVNHAFLADPVGNPRGYPRLPSMSVPDDVLAALAEWSVQRLGADGGPRMFETQVRRPGRLDERHAVRGR